MSLLDRGCTEPVVVYPEESYTDTDGNAMARASATPLPPTLARIQTLNTSGTSSRLRASFSEGDSTEENYNLRFTPEFTVTYGELGPRSQIEWRGVRWGIRGFPDRHASSPRTAHITYEIQRT